MNTTTNNTTTYPTILFSHPWSDGSTITFRAPVIASRLSDRAPIIRVPKRVASLKFPPFGGKRIVYLKPDMASKITFSL